MSYPQAISLAVVQAITEFLPVSSSGHLVIFQKLFGLSQPPVGFDVLVHLGTLGAIIFFLKDRLAPILRGLARDDRESWRVIWLVLVGTIPAGVVGFFLQPHIEPIFNSLRLVGVSLLVAAGLLFSTRLPALGRAEAGKVSKSLRSLSWADALLIGLFQALAILPGVSRSGSTITSGLWRGLNRETAFLFSFYLAIPAIIGATVLQLPEVINGKFSDLNQAFLGMLVAGVMGYLALVMLKKILVKGKLWLFGVYCLLLGLLLLLHPC